MLQAKLEDVEPSSAAPAPESAFLGPKLWQKPISFQEFNEDDFFVMNIEDFLTENDMDKQKLDRAMKVRLNSFIIVVLSYTFILKFPSFSITNFVTHSLCHTIFLNNF